MEIMELHFFRLVFGMKVTESKICKKGVPITVLSDKVKKTNDNYEVFKQNFLICWAKLK